MNREAIDRIAASAPEAATNTVGGGSGDGWLDAFIAHFGIAVTGPIPYLGGRKWQLAACPFDPSHADKDAIITESSNGAKGFHCSHNSCAGKNWTDFRAHYDPAKRWRLPGSSPRSATEGSATSSDTKGKRGPSQAPRIVRLADVEPESVGWVWAPYVPRRKLTIIEGDPGVGKTHVSLAIATAVSLGHGLPGVAPADPANVLILSAEDGLGDTIRPRLDLMGADVTRMFAVEGPLSFGGDEGEEGLAFVEAEIQLHRPALVVLDPLVFYLGGGVDLHRANEVRQVTARIAMLAEGYDCAILAVRHLTKGGRERAIYRGIGSIDLTAAARSVLLAGCDPDDPAKRAIAQIKNNLAALGAPLGFSLDGGLFTWLPSTDLTAARMLAAEGDGEEGGRLGEAEDFLRRALADGPRPAKEVLDAAKVVGIAARTLDRAKATVKVQARPLGKPGKRGADVWVWDLVRHDPLYGADGALNGSESEREEPGPVDGALNRRAATPGGAGMVTAIEILSTLEAGGVEVSVKDGKLRAVDPLGAITDELAEAIGQHKGEILALLGAPGRQSGFDGMGTAHPAKTQTVPGKHASPDGESASVTCPVCVLPVDKRFAVDGLCSPCSDHWGRCRCGDLPGGQTCRVCAAAAVARWKAAGGAE